MQIVLLMRSTSCIQAIKHFIKFENTFFTRTIHFVSFHFIVYDVEYSTDFVIVFLRHLILYVFITVFLHSDADDVAVKGTQLGFI